MVTLTFITFPETISYTSFSCMHFRFSPKAGYLKNLRSRI